MTLETVGRSAQHRPRTGPRDTDAAGHILGKYRLLSEVGRGAAATVYRAEDILSGAEVAVKLFGAPSGEQGSVQARLFFNEVRASRLLRHPGIVPVLDAGREGSRFYVVMEFVRGATTLEPACVASARLPVRRVLELALDCAEALHYAHGKGVIHRDVKPGNVLVDRRRRARLTDFGIAVLGEAGLGDTAPFAAAGSPLYMAPEQLRQDAVTPRSDLFALGITVYQLLSGVHPFAGKSVASITRRLLEEVPTPLDALRGDLPPGLSALVQRTLARDPDARPESGLALARELSELLGGARRPMEGLVAESRAQQLRRLELLRDFGDAEIWELLRWADWRQADAGDVVVDDAQPTDGLVLVVEGSASVRARGREVARLGRGACFGETAWLGARPQAGSLVALEASCFLTVDDSRLRNASGRCQIEFQRALIRLLVGCLAAVPREPGPGTG